MTCSDGKAKSFTGALCPNEEDDEREFCWKGCSVDKRFFASPSEEFMQLARKIEA